MSSTSPAPLKLKKFTIKKEQPDPEENINIVQSLRELARALGLGIFDVGKHKKGKISPSFSNQVDLTFQDDFKGFRIRCQRKPREEYVLPANWTFVGKNSFALKHGPHLIPVLVVHKVSEQAGQSGSCLDMRSKANGKTYSIGGSLGMVISVAKVSRPTAYFGVACAHFIGALKHDEGVEVEIFSCKMDCARCSKGHCDFQDKHSGNQVLRNGAPKKMIGTCCVPTNKITPSPRPDFQPMAYVSPKVRYIVSIASEYSCMTVG